MATVMPHIPKNKNFIPSTNAIPAEFDYEAKNLKEAPLKQPKEHKTQEGFISIHGPKLSIKGFEPDIDTIQNTLFGNAFNKATGRK